MCSCIDAFESIDGWSGYCSSLCSSHVICLFAVLQRDQVISFVPPDGAFKLMSYRCFGGSVTSPVYVRPSVSWRAGSGKLSIAVGTKVTQDKDRSIAGAAVVFVLPSCVSSHNLHVNTGTLHFSTVLPPSASVQPSPFFTPSSDVPIASQQLIQVRWDIGRISDKLPQLDGSLSTPSDITCEETIAVRLEFQAKQVTASGVRVEGLAIRSVSYKPHKGVRSMTQAGQYEVVI